METGRQRNSPSKFVPSSQRPSGADGEPRCPRQFGQPFATRQAVSRATFAEPSQTQIAAVRDYSRNVSVDETEPVDVKPNPDRPYFAHLAMCKDQKEDDKTAPIQPPLGWVLSKWTQRHFGDLLTSCENEKQLQQLETALGGKPPQNAGPEVGVLK